MKLAYQAYDRAGESKTDTIEAANADEATEVLRGRGLFVTDIEAASKSPDTKARRPRAKAGRGKRLKDLAMFTRQLYVLVASGTPLVQSLGALERQVGEGAWQDTIAQIRAAVEEGTPLAEAIQGYPEYFDTVYCSMVAAGEAGGNLPKMLDRLGKLTQSRVQVRNSIIGALVYPAVLVVVAVGVLTALLVFMIPRFAELFETLDAPLPGSTRAMIAISDALRAYWWGILGVAVGLGVGLKLWLGTSAGRRAVDTAVLRLPQVGRIVRNIITARITRLLGVLLDSQVPILEALRLARAGTGNVHYAELMAKAEDAVTHGDPMSSAMRGSDLISPSICEAIHSGEQSGRVGSLLLNIADFLDEENQVVVRSLTNILEPVILILMGLLVGFVAVSMFLPLFDLTAMTGGG